MVLTVKELARECGVPYYTIHYLNKLNKLPVEREGKRGVSTLFKQDAIEIVKKHKEK